MIYSLEKHYTTEIKINRITNTSNKLVVHLEIKEHKYIAHVIFIKRIKH